MNINKKEFFKKVKKRSSGCWEWIGMKNTVSGYGKFWLNQEHSKADYVHRISYQMYNGKNAKGLYILHKCDNKLCLNPKHLWAGTQKENMVDCKKKRRTTYGEKNKRAKLTEKEVMEIKNLYNINQYNQTELGRLYGVTQSAIYLIVRNINWSYLN